MEDKYKEQIMRFTLSEMNDDDKEFFLNLLHQGYRQEAVSFLNLSFIKCLGKLTL